ncbi:MAG: hypothetical protein NDJ89_05585 [Oligoflexia bacterium]|nr:hypothetical protein [Oligoflexia bacterium]
MKRVSLLAFVFLCSSVNAFAVEPVVQCMWRDSNAAANGNTENRFKLPLTGNDDIHHSFKSPADSAVTFTVSYTRSFNTVDTFIRDEELGVEAMATEWMNEPKKKAMSAVRLSTRKGSYILSCAIVGGE